MPAKNQSQETANVNLPLLVIVGPTGVGKTRLSLVLAERHEGEIISADSRLLYVGLDIGTDKPSVADRERIRHHLIDICLPDETVTLGQYKRLAETAIRDIHARNRLPLLVGGTGQYVRSVVEGWDIPEVAPNYALRKALLDLGQSDKIESHFNLFCVTIWLTIW